jgi:hypothetical protein
MPPATPAGGFFCASPTGMGEDYTIWKCQHQKLGAIEVRRPRKSKRTNEQSAIVKAGPIKPGSVLYRALEAVARNLIKQLRQPPPKS